MNIAVRTMARPEKAKLGQLTTEHAASSYGRPALLLDGASYGPADEIPGIGEPFLYAGHSESTPAPPEDWQAVADWNAQVRAAADVALTTWLAQPTL